MHMAYKGKKKDYFNEEQNTNLHGPWLFFLEFRVFISPLLVSTLEEIHSPKKVLLNKRVQKEKRDDLVCELPMC